MLAWANLVHGILARAAALAGRCGNAFASMVALGYERAAMMLFLRKAKKYRDRTRCTRKNAKHQAKNRGRRARVNNNYK